MLVLGIETTCDETAAAVVHRASDGTGYIRSNVVYSQIAEHKEFGGVVPEIAARAHVEVLDQVIGKALVDAQVRLSDCDAIAAAAGPGLIGGVIVGLTEAKAIALAAKKNLSQSTISRRTRSRYVSSAASIFLTCCCSPPAVIPSSC